MTANAFARIRKLDPIEGERWLPAHYPLPAWVSSHGRLVLTGSNGGDTARPLREALTVFDRRPREGERVRRVAMGDGVQCFGWSEDVRMAKCLTLVRLARERGAVYLGHRCPTTAQRRFTEARSIAERVTGGTAPRRIEDRLAWLDWVLSAEVAKIAERRRAIHGIAYTWGDISRK